MKKFLLLGMTALTAASVWALDPKVFTEFEVKSVSPDGAYVGLSDFMSGSTYIYNVATGELGEGWGEEIDQYTIGQGRAFSKDGIVVGSQYDQAAYLENGEWHDLNSPNPMFTSFAHGISSDGKMIVGIVGLAPTSLDDQAVPMKAPALWIRQDDGTYSDCIVLPYPEKDFTGRVPQYVTAISVSDDHKTIVGQVQDYSGSLTYLITFNLGDDNEWSYNDSYSKMVNPNNVDFPEDPGECPEYPELASFMSDDEKAAYDAAYQAYVDSGYDEELYPDINDYLTDEEKAAYDAALAQWEQDYEEWYARFEVFNEILEELRIIGKPLVFNNVLLSYDGKTVVSTVEITEEDPTSWFGYTSYYAPVTIDLTTSEYTCKPAEYNVLASGLTSNGTILGWVDAMEGRITKVFLPGSEEPVGMIGLLEHVSSPSVDWAKENLIHDALGFDWETYEEYTIPDVELAGVPYASDDMSIIASTVPVSWDDEDAWVYSYIFSGVGSGVKGVAADAEALAIKVVKGGTIVLNAEADVAVYDLNGALLYKGAGKNIETGLASGVYVVKVSANNETKTVKAVF